MIHVPVELRSRPFTTREAAAAGIGRGALSGPQFMRVHRGVYVIAGHNLNFNDRLLAAKLALPHDAHVSHVTRVRALGLDFGPSEPLHFTVARDLHLTPRGVFLHRTKVLPPIDGDGVSPASAYVQLAPTESLLDLIVVGDWLLNNSHMTQNELVEIAGRDPWRPGAIQAIQVNRYINARAASPQESRARAYLGFAGLPEPLVNVRAYDGPNSPILDLWWPRWMVAVEVEGGHHFTDPAQQRRDTWRYAELRERAIEYVQVYDTMLAHPRAFVRRVYDVLASHGYDGPPPSFGLHWSSLALRVPASGSRVPRLAAGQADSGGGLHRF